MKNPRPFHPPLTAIYTPLALYAANVSLIPLNDLWIPALMCLGAGLAIWAIAYAIVRDAARSAAIGTGAIVAVFAYGPIDEAMRTTTKPELANIRSLPLWIWTLAFVIVILAAERAVRRWPGFTNFLNAAAAAMVLIAAGTAAMAHWAVHRAIANSASRIAGNVAKPAAELPDIYYIVLDGYGRNDTFERLYDFTDREFTEWLEARGFRIAPQARSNYVQTELSMASSLNMAPIPELAKRMGDPTQERFVLDKRIDASEVSRRLRQMGYRYFAVTSGFPALTFDSADVVIRSDAGAGLFNQALWRKTPYRPSPEGLESMYNVRREVLRGAFKTLAGIAKPAVAPKFVVAHILAPHPPFVFGPEGEPVRPRRGPFGLWDGSHFRQYIGDAQEYRNGYRGQARYIARLAQDAIARILRESKNRAIIIVQGDHGPKSGLDQNSLEQTDLKEAFGILSAFHGPEAMRAKFAPDATPINTFRIVLGELEGRSMPMLPNKSEFSTWDAPLLLTDVTHEVD